MTRLFDIIISIFSLLILSPLFIIIAVLIKIDSDGPVFFTQNRIGKNGKGFDLIKFRSMHTYNSANKLLLTVGDDPRITKIGAFLRKYKLDELPQLFNVLIGEMSIVGPRPEVKQYVDLYNEEQRLVLVVRPGITDFASIKYSHENDMLKVQADPERYYIEHILPEKIKLNKVFISAPNVYNYFNIIFLTLRKVFTPQ